jgi:hypothetical protein
MKTNKSRFVVSILLLITSFCFAQTQQNISKIENRTKSYFNLNRENFYLHFNKSVYINTETIYFKGYVFDKTNEDLNNETTNVHVDFFTKDGTKIESKLLYAYNGEFEGFFTLKPTLESQIYYFQIYTNWCSNFDEDESGIFSVEIINPNTGRFTYSDDNPTLSLYPDGGNSIADLNNTIGVSVLDCHGKGVSVSDGVVLNEKGEEITTFQTNELGYGKFQLPETTNQIYSAKFQYNDKVIRTDLPRPTSNSTRLQVVNYINETKTFVTIEANMAYKDADNQHYLTVSQNDKVAVIAFHLNNYKKEITLADSLLFSGANIIRVLDGNLKQLNERVIYNYGKNTFSSNWNVLKKSTDSIKLSTTFLRNAKVSITVLPSESIGVNTTTTIANSFLLNTYINNKLPNGNDYFTDVNRKKKYELDLFLMSQKSKYQWADFETIPTEKYSFTKGLTLKGKINEPLDDLKKYEVQMFSFAAGINETTTINEKNEFYFNNMIASDSLQINFSLIKNGAKYKELLYFPQLISGEKAFNKPFQGIKTSCNSITKSDTKTASINELPALKQAISLKEVVINSTKNPNNGKLNSGYGNFNLKGKKVTEDDYKAYRFIIPYIQSKGFDAGINNGTVFIQGRTRTSFTKTNIPAVFIDDVQLYDFDILNNYSLEQVDAILINKYASGVQSQGFGVIKIYTNKDFKSKTTFISKSKPFIIKNGFAYEKPFQNPDYASTTNEGFKKYGTIGWIPLVDYSKKAILIEIPNWNQKEIKLQIEGIAEDGTFISEIKTISIP